MRYSLLTSLAFLAIFLIGCAQATVATDQATQTPSVEVMSIDSPNQNIDRTDPDTDQDGSSPQAAEPDPTGQPTATIVTTDVDPTAEITETLPTATSAPENWQDFPIIPEPNAERLGQIYQRGLELGNNSQAFSKVGDCGSTPAWFLGDFDSGPRFYRLGEHNDLEEVIQEFQGSYGRTSLAAKSGFNASSIFSLLWANREICQPDETPLACEYRVHKPSFAFIMLGSNDVYHQDSFEPQMRRIIEYSIENGVIPILSTKADNLEGDGSLNATIVRLAVEYELPLLNYWRAVQPLPNQGLQEDEVHITWGPNRFDDQEVMRKGWPWRNLTALQTLDATWRAATSTQ